MRALFLPAFTLASVDAALVARLMRGTMLEVLRADYVRTAFAKGLSKRTVILKHVMRNSVIPVVTYLGIAFGGLLGGALITEAIFNWPGHRAGPVDGHRRPGQPDHHRRRHLRGRRLRDREPPRRPGLRLPRPPDPAGVAGEHRLRPSTIRPRRDAVPAAAARHPRARPSSATSAGASSATSWPSLGLIMVGHRLRRGHLRPAASPPTTPGSRTSGNTTAKPSAAHWLGTDELGRDQLSRVIFGSRIAIVVGLASIFLALSARGGPRVDRRLPGRQGRLDRDAHRRCLLRLPAPHRRHPHHPGDRPGRAARHPGHRRVHLGDAGPPAALVDPVGPGGRVRRGGPVPRRVRAGGS